MALKNEEERGSAKASPRQQHVSYKCGGGVYVDQTVYLLRYVRGRGRGRWNRNGVGELERSRIALAIFLYIYSNVTSSVHVLRCDSNYASLCVGGPTYHTRHVAYVVCSCFFFNFFFLWNLKLIRLKGSFGIHGRPVIEHHQSTRRLTNYNRTSLKFSQKKKKKKNHTICKKLMNPRKGRNQSNRVQFFGAIWFQYEFF